MADTIDGTVGKSLAAVIRVPREQPREAEWASSTRSNEMPKDEPDTTSSSSSGKTKLMILQNSKFHFAQTAKQNLKKNYNVFHN